MLSDAPRSRRSSLTRSATQHSALSTFFSLSCFGDAAQDGLRIENQGHAPVPENRRAGDAWDFAEVIAERLDDCLAGAVKLFL